jgi:hypothetical protein
VRRAAPGIAVSARDDADRFGLGAASKGGRHSTKQIGWSGQWRGRPTASKLPRTFAASGGHLVDRENHSQTGPSAVRGRASLRRMKPNPLPSIEGRRFRHWHSVDFVCQVLCVEGYRSNGGTTGAKQPCAGTPSARGRLTHLRPAPARTEG